MGQPSWSKKFSTTFFKALIPFSKLELYSLKTSPVNMIAEITSIFFAGLFSSLKFFLR